MKSKIIYDGKGRLRIRCGKYAFSEQEGYGIAEYIRKEHNVYEVITSHNNGSILITYKEEFRDRLIDKIQKMERSDIVEVQSSGNDLVRKTDEEFQHTLAAMIVKRFLFKNLIPAPLRAAMTILRSISYLKEGISSLLSCNINVSVLDATAIGASIVQGSYSSANSIMFLLSISELLEDYTRKRTKDALTQSLAVNIDKVWLVLENSEVFVPMSNIKCGDKVRVRMGGMIPVDGTVVKGEAMINEASMTGEALAVAKTEGAFVYAGTVIEEGTVVIDVKAISSETRINKIIKMIDQSETLKANIQGKAEKLADSIVPFSFITAISAYIITRNISKALSVLMVDYSCAIKLSTPISVISAMREASTHNIMIKGGKYLEAFAYADTIIFDKTGTLTEACPKVAKVVSLGEYTREEVLKTAACLEEHFPHSVAKAIVKQAQYENLNHEEEHAEVEYIVAHGIASYLGNKKVLVGSGHFIFDDEHITVTKEEQQMIDDSINGCSVIYLAVGGKLAGFICINDPARKEAKSVISKLKKLGIKNIIMLTGDSENAANAVSRELGITKYRSQVLPEDKAEIIEEIKLKGKSVIMVGDGINDSPALSAANVSVAMKDSSDIAREVADITLLSADLNELITLRILSQSLMKKINQNYQFILLFNTSLLAMGLMSIITPATSALYHNVSTMAISAVSMKPCINKNDF